jgi:hypothetical protein
MKKIINTILSLVGCSMLLGAGEKSKESQSPYEGLRTQVLSLTLKQLGIESKDYKKQVYAILMETSYGDVSVSLLSVTDGTTSLYFSNGGGIIGAGEHAEVKKATLAFISKSEKYLKLAKLTKVFPLPKKGETKFYFMTKKGIYTYSALEDKLGNQKDKLSDLFYAGQNVISEVRKTQENK